MQVNRSQANAPAFNARFKIKGLGILEKADIDLLRSEAAKIGTKKDVIKVKLDDLEYGDTFNWAEQGLGWQSGRKMDSVAVNVKSIFNKITDKDNFRCYGHNDEEIAENIVANIKLCFEEFAEKLKK